MAFIRIAFTLLVDVDGVNAGRPTAPTQRGGPFLLPLNGRCSLLISDHETNTGSDNLDRVVPVERPLAGRERRCG